MVVHTRGNPSPSHETKKSVTSGSGRGKGGNIVSFIRKDSQEEIEMLLKILSKVWKVVVDKKYNQRSLKRTTSS
jgi:hypothetical protein